MSPLLRRDVVLSAAMAPLVWGLVGCGGQRTPVARAGSWADTVEIEQLMYRYCHRLDRGSAHQVAELFTPDAVFDPAYEGPGREVVGREAIEDWFARYHAASRTNNGSNVHRTLNPIINVNGDQAVAVAHLEASGVRLENMQAMAYIGFYEDVFQRINATWYFAQRRVSLKYYMPVGDAAATSFFATPTKVL